MAGGTSALLGTARTQQEERPTKTEQIPPIELGHLLTGVYKMRFVAL